MQKPKSQKLKSNSDNDKKVNEGDSSQLVNQRIAYWLEHFNKQKSKEK